MKRRLTVHIAGQEFTLISEEEDSYVRRVAAMVDSEIRAVIEGGNASLMNAAMLAGLNLAEQLTKAQNNAENLRTQLKDYVEELTRAKAEANELRRELNKQRRDAVK